MPGLEPFRKRGPECTRSRCSRRCDNSLFDHSAIVSSLRRHTGSLASLCAHCSAYTSPPLNCAYTDHRELNVHRECRARAHTRLNASSPYALSGAHQTSNVKSRPGRELLQSRRCRYDCLKSGICACLLTYYSHRDSSYSRDRPARWARSWTQHWTAAVQSV